MAKAQSASDEIAEIEREEQRIAEAAKALALRKKLLRKAAKSEGAKLLAASISRQKFEGVSKPLADQLAKQIATLGIAAAIAKLK